MESLYLDIPPLDTKEDTPHTRQPNSGRTPKLQHNLGNSARKGHNPQSCFLQAGWCRTASKSLKPLAGQASATRKGALARTGTAASCPMKWLSTSHQNCSHEFATSHLIRHCKQRGTLTYTGQTDWPLPVVCGLTDHPNYSLTLHQLPP